MKLVLDIGGISTKVAVFKENEMLHQFSIPYKKQLDVNELLALLTPESLKLINEYKITKICIAAPGEVNSVTGAIEGFTPIIDIDKVNLKEYFTKKFNLPTLIENDVNCSAIAELENGNAKGTTNAFIIEIGADIGGALIINKKLVKGIDMMGGELGNQIFDHLSNKTLSQLAGMYALESDYYKETKKTLPAVNIYENYSKDKICKKLIDNQIKILAMAAYNISCLINPEIILVGGWVSRNTLFLDKLKHDFNKLIEKFANSLSVKIEKCNFQYKAKLYGANLIKD